MTKQEILAKVNELIAAPSVCESVKKAAEAYAKSQDKKNADALVKVLEAEVCTIDESIGPFESETGAKIFGAEKAKEMAENGKKFKAAGNKYCFSPACQAGSVIWENRDAL